MVTRAGVGEAIRRHPRAYWRTTCFIGGLYFFSCHVQGGGYQFGELQASAADRHPSPQALTSIIENNLNSTAQRSLPVAVEFGGHLALADGQTVTRPIWLGGDHCAYIDPQVHQTGQVHLRQTACDHKQFAAETEVVAPLSVVYTDTDPSGHANRYYRVIMSSVGGNEADMLHVSPTMAPAVFHYAVTEQLQDMADRSVGDLAPAGN